MKKILILGCGKIGKIAFHVLKEKNYDVRILDKASVPEYNHSLVNLDLFDEASVDNFIKSFKPDAIVNCLPFYASQKPAEYAFKHNCHYFDVTEDVETGKSIKTLAQSSDKAFVPHCGLAPGIMSIISASMIKDFDSVLSVRAKCGVLPVYSNNSLKYGVTWSIDGLVNQYCNKCLVVEDHTIKEVDALDNLEKFLLDGVEYESFNTSGGIGTFVETFASTIPHISYQTIRYPGHRNLIHFLLRELGGINHRELLTTLLQNTLPVIKEDVTIINITVQGFIDGCPLEKSYSKKFYAQQMANVSVTSIEATTVGSLCSVISEVLSCPQKYKGFIKQEAFDLKDIQRHTTVNF